MKRASASLRDHQVGTPDNDDESVILVEQLAHVVNDTANDVCQLMGEGFPRSAYQLALFNHLAQMGLMLRTLSPSIHPGVPGAAERELIVVDDRLVVECILEHGLNADMLQVYKSRLALDVGTNGYEMGLVIDFGEMTGTSGHPVH